MKKLYSRLPHLMVEKDPRLNQRQLSRKLNLSHSTINKIYNGQPMKCRIDPETVEIICNYFDCEVGDLFVLKEESISN